MQEEEKFDFEKEKLNFKNSRMSSLRGLFKTFYWLAADEWRELDHKIFRVAMGFVGLASMAIFWLFFLRSFSGL